MNPSACASAHKVKITQTATSKWPLASPAEIILVRAAALKTFPVMLSRSRVVNLLKMRKYKTGPVSGHSVLQKYLKVITR